MNQNKLSFESENLVVDWIGFNIQGLLDKKQIRRIANYLFENFRFNATLANGPDRKQETLFFDSKNKYQVHFTVYRYSDIYWEGIKLDFSGQNGHQFYKLISANQLDWEILNPEKTLRLSRLDLCYRHKKIDNNTNLEPFLKQCYQKAAENKAIKNFSLQKSYLGWILRIGKRGSPNYYRVYENNTEIRFELEQRGSKIKSTQKLIFEYQTENFEEIMTETFFNYSKKVLAIDENYTNWLIDYFRRQNQTEESLVTGYFSSISFDQKKIFFRFLQFIAFSRTQKITTENFCEQPYSVVQFKITDFLNFIQKSNKNQYQLKQLIQFFDKLQTMKPFVKVLTSESFESFTIFPFVKTKKEFGKYGPWIIEVAILQDLYFYNYRFFFPKYFMTYQYDFELQIKLQFMQSYSTKNLKKIFYLEEILNQYKQANNQKKAKIKKIIQNTFFQALEHQMVQDNCQIKFKNKKRETQFIEIRNLTTLAIGQGINICFYEKIF